MIRRAHCNGDVSLYAVAIQSIIEPDLQRFFDGNYILLTTADWAFYSFNRYGHYASGEVVESR
jgi:hypothetical protein